ncbi:SDR family oxidoreductase [Nocardioides ginsengisegetis]|nr:glucose 1-dehydrogenase [Nocardioides ginsengisegetis]
MLSGKVAMITGAADGIGRAAVTVFAREGALVLACDIDGAGAEAAAAAVRADGGQALASAMDVSDLSQVRVGVELALTSWGSLDVAFNNAGITGPMTSLVDYPDEWFERVVAVNVRGTWNCLREQIPAMLQSGSGAIVNASSGAGAVGAPGIGIYAATKHAILGLTKVAALENATAGVRVNAVLPGIIDTNQPRNLTHDIPGAMDAFKSAMPIGRLGRADEVAEAAAWLCSDRASLVTGVGVAVDGGYLAQ